MADGNRKVTWKLALDVSEARAALNALRQEAGGVQSSLGGGSRSPIPMPGGGGFSGGGGVPNIPIALNAGSGLPPIGPNYGAMPVLALSAGGGGGAGVPPMTAIGAGAGGQMGGNFPMVPTLLAQRMPGGGYGVPGSAGYNAMRYGGSRMGGDMSAAFGYLAASHLINAASSTSQTLVQNAVSGRDTQWYDFAGAGVGLAGMGMGAAIGSIVPGIGTMFGAAIGAMMGSASGGLIQGIGGYYEARGRSNVGIGAMSGMTGAGVNAMFGDAGIGGIFAGTMGTRNAVGNLGGALMPTYGLGAAPQALAATMAVKSYIDAFGGDKSNTMVGAWSKAYAGAIGPGMGRFLSEPFSTGRAVRIGMAGGTDALNFYAGATAGGRFYDDVGKGGGPSPLINDLVDIAGMSINGIRIRYIAGKVAGAMQTIEGIKTTDLMVQEAGSTAAGFLSESERMLASGAGSRVAMGAMRSGASGLNLASDILNAAITKRTSVPGYTDDPTAKAEIAKLRASLSELRAAAATTGAGTGAYAMTTGMAGEYENASFGMKAAALGPFFSMNPRGSIAKMQNVVARSITEAQAQRAETTNPEAQLELTKTINGLRLEQMSLEQQMNYGWEGRIMEGSISLPNTGRGGTFRDALMFGHSNRRFGAGTRAAAAANRDWVGGTDATNRPGDMTARALETVVRNEVTIILKNEKGTTLGRTSAQTSARAGVNSDPQRTIMKASG